MKQVRPSVSTRLQGLCQRTLYYGIILDGAYSMQYSKTAETFHCTADIRASWTVN